MSVRAPSTLTVSVESKSTGSRWIVTHCPETWTLSWMANPGKETLRFCATESSFSGWLKRISAVAPPRPMLTSLLSTARCRSVWNVRVRSASVP